MERFLTNNAEWTKRTDLNKPQNMFKDFFHSKGNFFEVKNNDFYLQVNPLLNVQYGQESNYDKPIFQNTRGVYIRGRIADKIGFDVYFTDTQERDPRYVQGFVQKFKSIPGAGFYKPLGVVEGYDFTEVRGSISWKFTKFIDLQFGFDRNFIGNGFRSTFLSDFSNSGLFLKVNTRIWKFNYENLFMELIQPNAFIANGGVNLPRKYFRMNHLSINATKWLNIGIFDAVMFGRGDRFDFMYLNPVLFLIPGQQQIGSPDNAMLGIDFKANIAKKIQLYGQFNFDEFFSKDLFSDRNFWNNKYAYQIGLKYIDVLGIKNVDLQLESNRVRPFTYSHLDSSSNWTHYNQAFAHPLGANFQEYIAIIRAQPLKRLYLNARAIYYKQGLDSLGFNTGNNPLRAYTTRPRSNSWAVGSGDLANVLNISLQASYEIAENLFIDFTLNRRSFKTSLSGVSPEATIITGGIRWNMARREFAF
jgi:Capsule assembly protein Wzi